MQRGEGVKAYKELAVELLGGECKTCGTKELRFLYVLFETRTVYCVSCIKVAKRRFEQDRSLKESLARQDEIARRKGWAV